jgi:hypothetical protein
MERATNQSPILFPGISSRNPVRSTTFRPSILAAEALAAEGTDRESSITRWVRIPLERFRENLKLHHDLKFMQARNKQCLDARNVTLKQLGLKTPIMKRSHSSMNVDTTNVQNVVGRVKFA